MNQFPINTNFQYPDSNSQKLVFGNIGHWTLVVSVIGILVLLNFTSSTYAITSTSSGSKAQDLLDRVATRVAELATKLKKAYAGVVKSVGTETIVVTTSGGDRTLNVNQDLTAYYRFKSGTRSEIVIKNLKVGDDISAVGNVDPVTGEMSAKQIVAKTKRSTLVGTVESISKNVAVVAGQKVDLSTAVTIKKLDGSKGKLTDIKTGTLVFLVIYSSDSQLSALKIVYK